MCVCVCMHIYVSEGVCVYVCVCVCVWNRDTNREQWTCIHSTLARNPPSHISICTFGTPTSLHNVTSMYRYTHHLHAHKHIHVYTCMHTYKCKHMYIYIHIYTHYSLQGPKRFSDEKIKADQLADALVLVNKQTIQSMCTHKFMPTQAHTRTSTSHSLN